MRIPELFGRGKPVYSFEFFPPKSDAAANELLATVSDLGELLAPDYVSVTYGAGGSTRGRTVELVTRIQRELGVTAMAHLTCVGHSRAEIRAVLERLAAAGIENVLALRGDPPKGEAVFRPVEGGFAHASELVGFLTDGWRFGVGGACYPEKHPESPDAETDLSFTKLKVEAGVDFLVTQLFFDVAEYFRFVQRARAAGIHVPITPGIMPITSVSQIERFTEMCGAKIPADLRARLKRFEADPSSVMAIGIEHAIRQCRALLEGGAPGIHFYTLNKSHSTRSVLAAIKAL